MMLSWCSGQLAVASLSPAGLSVRSILTRNVHSSTVRCMAYDYAVRT